MKTRNLTSNIQATVNQNSANGNLYISPKVVKCKGEYWRTKVALAKAFGTQVGPIEYRMTNLRETREQALDHFIAVGKAFLPTEELREKYLAFQYLGDYFMSADDCAVHYGFKRGKVAELRRKYGFDDYEALDYLFAS